MRATWEATQALLGKVWGLEPVILRPEEATRVEQEIGRVYRSRERVERLLSLTERGYDIDRTAAQAAHNELVALLEQVAAESNGQEEPNA